VRSSSLSLLANRASSVADLVAQGHLVPGRYFSISEPDLSRIGIVAGDYHQGRLAEVMLDTALVGDAVQTWLARAGGRRTVVFATSISHSVALACEFRAYGVAAEHVDARTPACEREATFSRFRSGETQVLTNCTLASYGFDLPELDCIQLCRPTKSLVLYLQMIGRGLRPAPGKTHCLVLDHAGVVRRFGFADEPREWSLEGRVRDWRDDAPCDRSGKHKEPSKLRDCPECKALFTGRECPECGWYLKPRGVQIETLAGELVEIDDVRESSHERLRFYLQLRGWFHQRGKKPGAAAHSYREKFGALPPWKWNDYPMMQPGIEVERWLKSRHIAFCKRHKLRPSPDQFGAAGDGGAS
jgi:DNA repair protein RadD